MKGFIYYLKCPINYEIKYIGQTILPLNKRLKAHIYETNRNLRLGKELTHKENWIIGLIKLGRVKEITIHLIEEVDINLIDRREIYWISYYKNSKLTNIDLGGKRNFITEETKLKISKANGGENNGMYGKRYSLSSEQIEINRQAMIKSDKFQKSRKSKNFRDKIAMIQKVDDWYLLDENLNIIQSFNISNEIAEYLGCTKGNVKNARRDMRKLCKKYWVTYKNDYLNFIKIKTI